MPAPEKAHPCLPEELSNELQAELSLIPFTSYALLPQFEAIRHEIVKLTVNRGPLDMEVINENTLPQLLLPPSLDHIRQLMDNVHCRFRAGDGKNFLHSAVVNGDVLMAYETIRMGIAINAQDAEGVSPLFFALAYIYSLKKLRQAVAIPSDLGTYPSCIQSVLRSDEAFDLQISRVARIAALLIEQHADVTVGAFGFTPLTLAVEAGQWGLVNMLWATAPSPDLLHSLTLSRHEIKLVSPSLSTTASLPDPVHPVLVLVGRESLFPTAMVHRSKPIQDISSVAAESAKPTRLAVADGDSSSKRCGMQDAPESSDGFAAGWDIMQRIYARSDPWRLQEAILSFGKEKRCDLIYDRLAALGREDDVDPAFWHAMYETDFYPRPWSTHVSSLEGQRRMKEWTCLIDEYIRETFDLRPTWDIEIEAKIDSRGGPLYKKCEA
ncbi:hypothetical protein EIP86_007634 [Pleurotus ostreatoroseus]|nr:hypothetical protein EIP86_007634 [Pleurotus ostreatoroseus]